MSFVLVDLATGTYVATYDPNFVPPSPYPSYPSGYVLMTDRLEDALGFETWTDAFEAWRCPSLTVPLRPDGRPNRPLAGRTMEIVERP